MSHTKRKRGGEILGYDTYVAKEYVKIIQHEHGMEKWIIIKMRRYKWMKMIKIWMKK